MSAQPVDVLAVIESCRDRFGHLDEDGRHLEWCMRKAREWTYHGMHECAADAIAAAQSSAASILGACKSLRAAGRVPVTMLASRRAANRRARRSA